MNSGQQVALNNVTPEMIQRQLDENRLLFLELHDKWKTHAMNSQEITDLKRRIYDNLYQLVHINQTSEQKNRASSTVQPRSSNMNPNINPNPNTNPNPNINPNPNSNPPPSSWRVSQSTGVGLTPNSSLIRNPNPNPNPNSNPNPNLSNPNSVNPNRVPISTPISSQPQPGPNTTIGPYHQVNTTEILKPDWTREEVYKLFEGVRKFPTDIGKVSEFIGTKNKKQISGYLKEWNDRRLQSQMSRGQEPMQYTQKLPANVVGGNNIQQMPSTGQQQQQQQQPQQQNSNNNNNRPTNPYGYYNPRV